MPFPAINMPVHFDDNLGGVAARTLIRLHGRRVVLVDKAAKHIVTMDVYRRGSGGEPVAGHRNAEVDAPMRTLLVVVADVLPKDSFEVTMSHYEDPVEAFGPHCPHPAFRRTCWPEETGRAS